MKDTSEKRESNKILEDILLELQSNKSHSNDNSFTKDERDSLKINDLIALLSRYEKLWYLPILTICFGLFSAYVINHRLQNTYSVTALLNIEETDNDFLSTEGSLSFGFGASNIVDSRIAILNSYSHNMKVAEKLQWFTKYFEISSLGTKENYYAKDYRLVLDTNHQQLLGCNFILTLYEDEFQLELKKNGDALSAYSLADQTKKALTSEWIAPTNSYKYDSWIESPYYRFKILKTATSAGKNAYFKFQTFQQIGNWGISTLKTMTTGSTKSGLLELSMLGFNPHQMSDYINTSIEVLQSHELDQKNTIASNTLLFIEKELNGLRSELSTNESSLESFRSSNLIINLDSETQDFLTQLNSAEQQFDDLTLEHATLKYLQRFTISSSIQDDISLPSIQGIQDPLVVQLVQKLFQQKSLLASMDLNLEASNPAQKGLKQEINYTETSLKNAIANALAKVDFLLANAQNRLSALQQDIQALPAMEQEMIGLTRKYTITENQYSLLLQKRSEAQIAKASNISDTKIIDPAMDIGQKPVGPNRPRNYAVGGMVGLIIPFALVFFLHFITTKIKSREDLAAVTDLPIIGGIPISKYNGNMVCLNDAHSPVTEAFRALRTTLDFVAQKGEGGRVIGVSSSVPSEGKTFISINLASILALGGEKTVLIGADLRKPKIYEDLNCSNEKGLSSYLAGVYEPLEVIQPTDYDNLDFISAGQIPPNPFELLSSARFGQLLSALRGSYDRIIIDTPPLGLVADTININHHFDHLIYVVRHNVTDKNALSYINDLRDRKVILNVSIVFNAVPQQSRYGYGYGYGYGYN